MVPRRLRLQPHCPPTRRFRRRRGEALRLALICASLIWAAQGCSRGDVDVAPSLDTRTTLPDNGAPPEDAPVEACPSGTRSFSANTLATDVLRAGHVGRVSRIIDGDTLDVLVDGTPFRVRLVGVSAPECLKGDTATNGYACVRDDEWHGLGSYDSAVSIVGEREVRVSCEGARDGEPCPTDVYDRYLAYVELACIGDLGEALIGAGGGLAFTRYPSAKRGSYCEAEATARAASAGLWSLGDRSTVLAAMSENTRSWYVSHDRLCAAATP